MAERVPGGPQLYRQPDESPDWVPRPSPPDRDQVAGGTAVVELEPTVSRDHHPNEHAGRSEREERDSDEQRLGGQHADRNENPQDDVGTSECPGADI